MNAYPLYVWHVGSETWMVGMEAGVGAEQDSEIGVCVIGVCVCIVIYFLHRDMWDSFLILVWFPFSHLQIMFSLHLVSMLLLPKGGEDLQFGMLNM